MLAYRPGSGLSVPYRALFAPLLSPVLWERRGNVPALAELLHSYIVRDISYILSAGALPGVLGVFQKLLSSRANEAYAFRVLDSLLIACPTAAMSPFSPTAMQLLLQRLQDAVRDDRAAQQPGEPARSAECRNPRYVRRVLHTVAAYATAHGGVAATALLDSAQGAGSGLSVQVATGVWGRLRALLLIGPAAESRRIVAGLTRMLCESVLRDAPAAFVALLSLAVDIARTLGGTARPDDEDTTAANDDSPEAREFDSSYSKLVYAGGPPDAESDIVTGAKGYLPAQLATLCTGSAKGTCLTAVQALPQELQQALQQLCQEARVTLQ